MTNDTIQARDLAAIIRHQSKRLEPLRRMGRYLERQTPQCRQTIRHLSTVSRIAFYCLVLRHHEPDLLRLQWVDVFDPCGLGTVTDKLMDYAAICDAYHRNVLHDGGVTLRRHEWIAREPDTPPTFPERIEVPAECFTPITTK